MNTLDFLPWIPACPLFGFLILALFGSVLGRKGAIWVGVGSVVVAALLSVMVAISFGAAPPPHFSHTVRLWTWMAAGDFAVDVAFHLDALSLVMVLVVTSVGALIHLYAAEYMSKDPDIRRFFAYLNLFVASMLILLLADNFAFLYLGWEGVGLCSYLLIGFWYRETANGAAARKAFIVTRVGDVAMAVGIFFLFYHLGTLNIRDAMEAISHRSEIGSTLAVVAATLLLIGALGKSAQLPLQVWLPDAMAGPTPVSALIHAATMVTAGVYLIARTHTLFALAPSVQYTIALIGTATLFIAGLSAFVQRDLKRILAYSTISQVGYMFLALGVGAWSAALFHFWTHAFFKALLFLGAGAVIQHLHHEQDIFRMGGLRKKLPLVFWTMLIGSASLAGLPLVTAGFYSKDLILWQTWAGEGGSHGLWFVAWFSAMLTSFYAFRLIFVVFFGKSRTEPEGSPGWRMNLPLIVLALLALIGGFIETPPTLGGIELWSHWIRSALPPTALIQTTHRAEVTLQLLAALASLGGIYLAYTFYVRFPKVGDGLMDAPLPRFLHRWWLAGWGFDALYHRIFVRPYVRAARASAVDLIDTLYRGVVQTALALHRLFAATQTGRVRRYAAGIALGAILAVGMAVFA